MLTSVEAAKASGVSPSTFRAYVARGQAPKPQHRAGGVNMWSLTDLAAWRDLDLDDAERRGIRADVAVLYAQGRDWEESTRRCLAQVTLDHQTAQSMIDGYTGGGMSVEVFRDAQFILRTMRALRRHLADARGATLPDPTPEQDLIRATAGRVADGADAFTEFADLVFETTTRGNPEPLLPRTFDRSFWTSQDDADDFTRYLSDLERADIPEVA